MLNMKDIANYGFCYIVSIVCPADGVDFPRKTTLFEVCNGVTDETLDTFRTARQAKKFAHHYISDPEGTVQQMRQLSADRIIHNRALMAIVLLGNYSKHDVVITDKCNPQATPERYKANDIFVPATENRIVIWYYPFSEDVHRKCIHISGLRAVRAINESTFAFETYQGKIYTISGKD